MKSFETYKLTKKSGRISFETEFCKSGRPSRAHANLTPVSRDAMQNAQNSESKPKRASEGE